MAKNYPPSEIEQKWQKTWEKSRLFYQAKDSGAKKYYALVEFPYPSGEGLHMGHAFTMTIMDVFVKKKRGEGWNVLCPMGWDAFGLPTENYAIRTGIHPAVATKRNTDHFRKQMKRLGFHYNWEREVNTTDPDYYRFTQWIFVQFFKHGLAYKAKMPVGWCPSCKIILSNEEIVNGRCERCGIEAERRMQAQWLLRITAYADRLVDELDLVDYPDYVREAQRNWIGKTQGIKIEYPVVGKKFSLVCYTTRPDTNFGATFIVVAPEHPLVEKLTTPENCLQVQNYIKQSKTKSELERTALEKEKTGVFTGSYALNRLTGKKMPIWVSDFVVLTAGTGVVVGVPAHDERDFAFAKKYGLEIIPVIKPKATPRMVSEGLLRGETAETWDFEKGAFVDTQKAVVFNSDFLDGLPVSKAIKKITNYLVKKGWGKRAVNYHLRDWIFSRQHYWGEPIPMIYCKNCAQKDVGEREEMPGWFTVNESELPVKLPEVEKYQPTDTGESPLANIKDWVNITCPNCGSPARRETDTMPNWAGSSWYYLRYCDSKNSHCLADPKKLQYWLPVDLYLGGGEHTTLHLLYSRFWHKFLNDIGAVFGKEPYLARRQHGVILGEDGFRMSKSRGNVVNPEAVIEKFGADTLRVYLMFMGPYDATITWDSKGVMGVYRFLSRVWRLYSAGGRTGKIKLKRELHLLIKKVGEDIDAFKHNTAIAAMMAFLNKWQADGSLSKKDAGAFLRLLAPFAPFLAEELWQKITSEVEGPGESSPRRWRSIHQQPWPKYDPKLIKEEKVTIVVQVNGKVRGQIEVEYKIRNSQSEIEKLAKKEPRVAKYLAGKKIKKTIFVPGKLINFVV